MRAALPPCSRAERKRESMEIQMKDITCPKCGIVFAITSVHDSNLRECHNTFYCPSGHSQSYPHKTEAESLKEKVSAQERSLKYFRDLEEKRVAEYKKKFDAKMKRQKAAKQKVAKKK
jgi:hypothetical protein